MKNLSASDLTISFLSFSILALYSGLYFSWNQQSSYVITKIPNAKSKTASLDSFATLFCSLNSVLPALFDRFFMSSSYKIYLLIHESIQRNQVPAQIRNVDNNFFAFFVELHLLRTGLVESLLFLRFLYLDLDLDLDFDFDFDFSLGLMGEASGIGSLSDEELLCWLLIKDCMFTQ